MNRLQVDLVNHSNERLLGMGWISDEGSGVEKKKYRRKRFENRNVQRSTVS